MGNGYNPEDKMGYISFIEEEYHDKYISRWGSDTAYELYKNKGYSNLEGYILYYIFEVVATNCKMNHFENSTGEVLLNYHEEGIQTEILSDMTAICSRTLVLTKEEGDIRELGEGYFIDFVKRYVTTHIRHVVNVGRYVWEYTGSNQEERVLDFCQYAVKENIGILSEEGYTDIKETLFKEYNRLEEEKRHNNGLEDKNRLRIRIDNLEKRYE